MTSVSSTPGNGRTRTQFFLERRSSVAEKEGFEVYREVVDVGRRANVPVFGTTRPAHFNLLLEDWLTPGEVLRLCDSCAGRSPYPTRGLASVQFNDVFPVKD